MAKTAPIPAPAQRAPRFGFLAAAPDVSQRIGSDRWALSGVTWQPSTRSEPGAAVAIDCGDWASALVANTDVCGTAVAVPFLVPFVEGSSTFGLDGREWQARIRRGLEETQSYVIARELWTGAATGADQEYLAKSTSDTLSPLGTAMSVADAVACIDQYIADTMYGRLGMIHMRAKALNRAVTQEAARLDGNQWVSPMGNLIVVDAGYDGTSPIGTTEPQGREWVYGTSMISYALGPTTVVPGSLAEARALGAAVLDVSTNDFVAYGFKPALYLFDGDCHCAAMVETATCAPAGAS